MLIFTRKTDSAISVIGVKFERGILESGGKIYLQYHNWRIVPICPGLDSWPTDIFELSLLALHSAPKGFLWVLRVLLSHQI